MKILSVLSVRVKNYMRHHEASNMVRLKESYIICAGTSQQFCCGFQLFDRRAPFCC